MNEARKKHHGTKHGLHPALPVILAFFGTVVVSVVFGMLIFPIFAQVCATDLLEAVVKVGYAGIIILGIALAMEAYNLFEHHKRHVSWLVIGGVIGLGISAMMLSMAPSALQCVA